MKRKAKTRKFDDSKPIAGIQKRLSYYKSRAAEIEDLKETVKKKVKAHNEQTRKDFGIADSDVLSVETIVNAFSRLAELPK